MILTACGLVAFIVLTVILIWALRLAVLRVQDPWLWTICGGLVVFSLILVANPRHNYLLPFDDAFYYLKVASNVAAHGVPTFDGLHATNGWHPLWLCLLSALHWAFSPSQTGFITAAFITNWFFLLGSLALLLVLLKDVLSRWSQIVVLVILANPWVTTRFWPSLMENVIAQFLLLACLVLVRELAAAREFRPWRWLAHAGICGLLILARLDMVLFVATVSAGIIYLAYVKSAGHCWAAVRRTAAWGAAVSVLPALYLAWNYANFGHLSTVSSYVKVVLHGSGRTISERYDNLCGLFSTLPMIVPISTLRIVSPILIVVSLLLALYLARSVLGPGDRLPIGLLWAGAAVHFLVMRTVSIQTFSWYYTAEILGAAVGAGVLASLVESRFRVPGLLKWSIVAIAAGANVILTVDALGRHPRFFHSNAVQVRHAKAFAEWLNSNLPTDAVLGSWDAGILGYFCSNTVINLDGVINSYDYIEYMRRGAYPEYVRSQRIQYIVNYVVLEPEGRVKLLSRPGAEELRPHLTLEHAGPPIAPLVSRSRPTVVYALFKVGFAPNAVP